MPLMAFKPPGCCVSRYVPGPSVSRHSGPPATLRSMAPTTRCTVAALVFCLLPAAADTHHGRVVAVTDGDTIKILAADNHQGRIRLADRAKARQVEVSNHVTVNISVDNYLPI